MFENTKIGWNMFWDFFNELSKTEIGVFWLAVFVVTIFVF